MSFLKNIVTFTGLSLTGFGAYTVHDLVEPSKNNTTNTITKKAEMPLKPDFIGDGGEEYIDIRKIPATTIEETTIEDTAIVADQINKILYDKNLYIALSTLLSGGGLVFAASRRSKKEKLESSITKLMMGTTGGLEDLKRLLPYVVKVEKKYPQENSTLDSLPEPEDYKGLLAVFSLEATLPKNINAYQLPIEIGINEKVIKFGINGLEYTLPINVLSKILGSLPTQIRKQFSNLLPTAIKQSKAKPIDPKIAKDLWDNFEHKLLENRKLEDFLALIPYIESVDKGEDKNSISLKLDLLSNIGKQVVVIKTEMISDKQFITFACRGRNGREVRGCWSLENNDNQALNTILQALPSDSKQRKLFENLRDEKLETQEILPLGMTSVQPLEEPDGRHLSHILRDFQDLDRILELLPYLTDIEAGSQNLVDGKSSVKLKLDLSQVVKDVSVNHYYLANRVGPKTLVIETRYPDDSKSQPSITYKLEDDDNKMESVGDTNFIHDQINKIHDELPSNLEKQKKDLVFTLRNNKPGQGTNKVKVAEEPAPENVSTTTTSGYKAHFNPTSLELSIAMIKDGEIKGGIKKEDFILRKLVREAAHQIKGRSEGTAQTDSETGKLAEEIIGSDLSWSVPLGALKNFIKSNHFEKDQAFVNFKNKFEEYINQRIRKIEENSVKPNEQTAAVPASSVSEKSVQQLPPTQEPLNKKGFSFALEEFKNDGPYYAKFDEKAVRSMIADVVEEKKVSKSIAKQADDKSHLKPSIKDLIEKSKNHGVFYSNLIDFLKDKKIIDLKLPKGQRSGLTILNDFRDTFSNYKTALLEYGAFFRREGSAADPREAKATLVKKEIKLIDSLASQLFFTITALAKDDSIVSPPPKAEEKYKFHTNLAEIRSKIHSSDMDKALKAIVIEAVVKLRGLDIKQIDPNKFNATYDNEISIMRGFRDMRTDWILLANNINRDHMDDEYGAFSRAFENFINANLDKIRPSQN